MIVKIEIFPAVPRLKIPPFEKNHAKKAKNSAFLFALLFNLGYNRICVKVGLL